MPNVETLALPGILINTMKSPYNNSPLPTFHSEMWIVVEAIRQGIDRNLEGASLGKLTTLQAGPRELWATRIHFNGLSIFLAMPNITELIVDDCIADESVDLRFRWDYPGISSGLRRIVLDNSSVDADSISQLLAHTPQLVSFKYSHEAASDGGEFWWDAGSFVDIIGKHVGDTLEELAVTIGRDGGISTGVASMTDFVKLKKLEIDIYLFYGPSAQSGESIDPFYVYPLEGFEPWIIESIPPLTEILPPSLECLDLFKINDPEDCCPFVERLFFNFAVDRPRALPSLDENLTLQAPGVILI
ncbi:hypothetical protein F4804DRAFT_334470 [Jackrogersella minutella]|nr:hypothetical protein F4804DRAFT_334470 [Jackrogersella minutella]